MSSFRIGEVVVLVEKVKKYPSLPIPLKGVLTKTWKGNYGVSFPDRHNPSASSGLYWVTARSIVHEEECEVLEEVESEVEFMSNPIIDFPLAARVIFLDDRNPDTVTREGNREYWFACYAHNILIDNVVAVTTNHHGYAFAKVVDISHDPEILSSVTPGHEIISSVNFDDYLSRVDKRARAKELQKELDKGLRNFQRLSMYKMAAQNDPHMRAMLEEYTSLLGITSSESDSDQVSE